MADVKCVVLGCYGRQWPIAMHVPIESDELLLTLLLVAIVRKFSSRHSSSPAAEPTWNDHLSWCHGNHEPHPLSVRSLCPLFPSGVLLLITKSR